MKCGAGMAVGLWVGALTAALLQPGRTTRAEEPDRSTVRIGVVSSLFRGKPDALVLIGTRPLKELMEQQIGVRSQIVLGAEAEELGRRLNSNEVQIGVFHGFEFAWAQKKYPNLKPLIVAVNQDPVLHANLVVRKECKAASYADLKGQKIAFPTEGREHCRLYLERRCSAAGVAPKDFYARVEQTRRPADGLDDVFDGDVQAAVIDSNDLEAYRKNKPNRFAQLRVLQQSEAFPCAIVGYCPGGITEDQATRFRNGMVAANQTEQGKQVLSLCRITSFEQVPVEFEQLLVEVAKAYPPEAGK